jgi:hypothetical protein
MFGIRLPILLGSLAALGALAALVLLLGGSSDDAVRASRSSVASAPAPRPPAMAPLNASAGAPAARPGEAADARSAGGPERPPGAAASPERRSATAAALSRSGREEARDGVRDFRADTAMPGRSAGYQAGTGLESVTGEGSGGSEAARPGFGGGAAAVAAASSGPGAGSGDDTGSAARPDPAGEAARLPELYDRSAEGEWRIPGAETPRQPDFARYDDPGAERLSDCAAAGTCYDRQVEGDWRFPD